jgi:predicted Zn-dependent peptidase
MDAILDEPGTRMGDAFTASKRAYGGDTFIQLFSDVGLWRAHGGGDADEALQIVQEELRRLQTELVPEAELRAATRYLAGRILLSSEFTSDQAVRLARLTLFGSYKSEEQEAARLLAVTAEDVQRVAQTYFNPETLSVIRPQPSGPESEESR